MQDRTLLHLGLEATDSVRELLTGACLLDSRLFCEIFRAGGAVVVDRFMLDMDV